MDQEPIWNQTALSANCTTMDAEHLLQLVHLYSSKNQKRGESAAKLFRSSFSLDRVAWCYSKNIENTDVVSFNHLSELAIRSAP